MNGAFTKLEAQKVADFIFVKGTQNMANEFKAKGAPMVVIVDPDRSELVRMSLKDEASLVAALDEAMAKYADKPISWANEISEDAGSKKLLVVGFDDEKEENLKVLEDRAVAKLHDRCTFVRLPYQKEGEIARKWGVVTVPTLFLCDASKPNPERNYMEKLTGKRTAPALRATLLKALARLEAKK